MSLSKQTPLLSAHRALGARLVDFAGFLMPLQYSGILDEHHTVRRAVGLFDVSHMGEILFSGANAIAAVDRLVCNDVRALADGQCLYTPITYPHGGIVDDCLVYRQAADRVLIVVNAANHDKVLAWFVAQTDARTRIDDISAATALLALQGPRAEAIWRHATGDRGIPQKPFTFAPQNTPFGPCTVSRTGYTGEAGFEIFSAADDAPRFWRGLLAQGAAFGLKPCGLGARDTLRLEACLPLYGHELDQDTTPFEAGLGFTVKLDGEDFIGRDALRQKKEEGLGRRLVCLVLRERGIARHGYPIYRADGAGDPIGVVTSGTLSPTLGQAVALGYVAIVQASQGTRLAVDIRGKRVAADVIKGPFYKRQRPLGPGSSGRNQ